MTITHLNKIENALNQAVIINKGLIGKDKEKYIKSVLVEITK